MSKPVIALSLPPELPADLSRDELSGLVKVVESYLPVGHGPIAIRLTLVPKLRGDSRALIGREPGGFHLQLAEGTARPIGTIAHELAHLFELVPLDRPVRPAWAGWADRVCAEYLAERATASLLHEASLASDGSGPSRAAAQLLLVPGELDAIRTQLTRGLSFRALNEAVVGICLRVAYAAGALAGDRLSTASLADFPPLRAEDLAMSSARYVLERIEAAVLAEPLILPPAAVRALDPVRDETEAALRRAVIATGSAFLAAAAV